MDPHCAGIGERAGDLDGIVAVHRRPAVVALGQAHDLTAAEVDRRVQVDHHQPAMVPATRRTKLPRRARPHAADFSGWNWVAKTLS